MRPPFSWQQVSLFNWVGVFGIKIDDGESLKNLTWGYLSIPYPLWSCNCDSVLWVVMVVIQSAVQWHLQAKDVCPSTKCMRSCRHPLPLHVTWSLHPSSVDTPVDTQVDIHGKSHNFPLIHPREVWLAYFWVNARQLSTHGVILLSFPLGFGLTEVGLLYLSHAWWTPKHKGTPVSDAMRSQLCVGNVTVCIGLSLCTRGCPLWSDAPPCEICPPTYL